MTPLLTLDGPCALLEEAATRTRHIVEAHDLDETARLGGRFRDPATAHNCAGFCCT